MTENHWAPPAPEMVSKAKERALAAMRSPEAGRKLRRFYDTSTDYAGSSFTMIGVNSPDRIGADDLFATTLLSVKVPAKAARLLTGEGPVRRDVSSALGALPSGPLEKVDDAGLAAMEAFYLHVKHNLAKANVKKSNAWVVASKLCARKRPDLFPVRDNVVCRLLDIQRANNFRVDWLVFASLMSDQDVRDAIESVRDDVAGAGDATVVLDAEPLRLLDAALWSSVKIA